MPVEIKELVIRAVVDLDRSREPGDGGDGQSVPSARDEIVQACVRQVLRILEKSRER